MSVCVCVYIMEWHTVFALVFNTIIMIHCDQDKADQKKNSKDERLFYLH